MEAFLLPFIAAKGNRRAKTARHILAHIDVYIGATQFGITMVSLGLGYLGQPVFTTLLEPFLVPLGVVSSAWLHSISFAVGFSALTFLHITVGELAPKWLTIQKPLPVALAAAYPLRWFYLALYPFNRLLNRTARWLLTRIGIEPDGAADRTQSEEELRLLITSAQGVAGGRNIILNALDLHHRIAREVMRPRHEIIAFNTAASLADCLALAEKTRYSRFPLCAGGDFVAEHGADEIHQRQAGEGKIPARQRHHADMPDFDEA